VLEIQRQDNPLCEQNGILITETLQTHVREKQHHPKPSPPAADDINTAGTSTRMPNLPGNQEKEIREGTTTCRPNNSAGSVSISYYNIHQREPRQ
jgi:hypothetical protein